MSMIDKLTYGQKSWLVVALGNAGGERYTRATTTYISTSDFRDLCDRGLIEAQGPRNALTLAGWMAAEQIVKDWRERQQVKDWRERQQTADAQMADWLRFHAPYRAK